MGIHWVSTESFHITYRGYEYTDFLRNCESVSTHRYGGLCGIIVRIAEPLS